jgi:hypothetical protein
VVQGKITEEGLQLKSKFIEDLQSEIVYTLSENSMIMATSMLSSIILTNRKEGHNEEELLK